MNISRQQRLVRRFVSILLFGDLPKLLRQVKNEQNKIINKDNSVDLVKKGVETSTSEKEVETKSKDA